MFNVPIAPPESEEGQIRELNETRSDGAHRPAKLYSFQNRDR